MTTSGVNAGFQLTAPADTSVKTLLLYVFINPNAQISAAVSDGSSPSITHSPATSQDAGYEIYSIDYRAASPGQTMTVQIVFDRFVRVSWSSSGRSTTAPSSSLDHFTYAKRGVYGLRRATRQYPGKFDATQFDTNIASVQLWQMEFKLPQSLRLHTRQRGQQRLVTIRSGPGDRRGGAYQHLPYPSP